MSRFEQLFRYVRQFFKIRISFPHALSLKRSREPQFIFAFLTQVTHYLTEGVNRFNEFGLKKRTDRGFLR